MPLFYFRLCDLTLLPDFLSPGLPSQPGYPRVALEDAGSMDVYTRLQNTFCCCAQKNWTFYFNLMSLPGTGKFHRTNGDLASREKAQCRFCPGLYFYPSPLYLGLKCSLNNQLESKKYVQFFCSWWLIWLFLNSELSFLVFKSGFSV